MVENRLPRGTVPKRLKLQNEPGMRGKSPPNTPVQLGHHGCRRRRPRGKTLPASCPRTCDYCWLFVPAGLLRHDGFGCGQFSAAVWFGDSHANGTGAVIGKGHTRTTCADRDFPRWEEAPQRSVDYCLPLEHGGYHTCCQKRVMTL